MDKERNNTLALKGVGCTEPSEGEVPGPLGLYSERNKMHFLLDTSQILTSLNWGPWAESGTGSEAKQGEGVRTGGLEGKGEGCLLWEAAGLGHSYFN